MEAKSYSRLAGAIFAVIAVLQIMRAFSGWEITLNGTPVEMWIDSGVVAGLAATIVSYEDLHVIANRSDAPRNE